jgi:phenylacetate-CoA ligase
MADDSFPARSAIASSQREQLRRLLAVLVPANSFYTQKFSRAGVTTTVTCLDEFSEKFPFTTKEELADDQRAQPPYGTNLTFPLERYTRFHQTSGTTGAPLRWLDTPESWNWMVENWIEILRAAGAGQSSASGSLTKRRNASAVSAFRAAA